MIDALVKYHAPEGVSRQEVIDDAQGVVAKWRANPDLIRKHFMWSDDKKWLSGFYLWKSRAAAEAAHNAEWRDAVEQRTGQAPEISYFDAFMILDNEVGDVEVFEP